MLVRICCVETFQITGATQHDAFVSRFPKGWTKYFRSDVLPRSLLPRYQVNLKVLGLE